MRDRAAVPLARSVPPSARASITEARLGLAANWPQFTLLVVVNAFVGAMVGLERATLPLVAEVDYGIASSTTALFFVATFGVCKAVSNLSAGWLGERHGRRNTLLAGWVLALPIPPLIVAAPSWSWIVLANALLGISQGLAWSMTVLMKIDLVGPRRRGLAMGLNESAGYLAVSLASLGSGFAAAAWGLRAGPAYVASAVAVVGLLVSALFVRDTSAHVRVEQSALEPELSERPSLRLVLRRSLWSDANLFSTSQAGFINNLNDGLAWGLFPLFFSANGLPLEKVAALAAVYPGVWGLGQLATGPLSDRFGRKSSIVVGMILQGGALIAISLSGGMREWALALVALGIGTALVYPALLAAIGDISLPSWRSSAVGVYRLWRDLGYVGGALAGGAIADVAGMPTAIAVVGVVTALSGVLFAARFEGSPTGEQ